MMKKKSDNTPKTRRKAVRKECRLTVRFTQPLYEALDHKAYEENKSNSTIIIEAVMKYLDFKMPPKSD